MTTLEDDLPTTDGGPNYLGADIAGSVPVVAGYKVHGRIGSGGMGEVYAAEQLAPVRRQVALKVIKAGMDSREVVARFESERQALAMMDHACIARVLDAGTSGGGRPFFAMEYVKGIPITDHCDQYRLPNRERLALFVRVCEGVQHAHQKAIIHRDLKPSNVLVTIQGGRAEPKIIDFGVAKALGQRLTDSTMHTQLGQVIGTLEYMSPEQANLSAQDIDTRSDVYSLGVLLYELLVGQLPFESSSLRDLGFDEVRRRIRDEEPRRPSARLSDGERSSALAGERRGTDAGTLARQLRGDLDWITMKALEKDRTRRYGSVAELATDVQRYLEDRPVTARPPSLSYKLRKLARRHRAAVIAATVTAVGLVAGLTLATTGLMRASRERDRARLALAEAETATAFLTDMLAAADPANSGRDVTVRQVLDAAVPTLEERFGAQPLVEARLRQTVGTTYLSLGLLDEAQAQLPRALVLRGGILGANDAATLASMAVLGELRYAQGRFGEAETLFGSVLESRRRVLGERHPDTDKARILLGNLRFQQGRYDEAAELHTTARDGLQASLGEDAPETLMAAFNLASDFWAAGRLEQAEPLYRRVLDGRTRTRGAEHPETLDAINNLAALYHVQGRFADAESLYRRALATGRKVRGDDHPETLITLGNLGELLLDEGSLKPAVSLLTDALERKQAVLGAEHPSTLYTLAVLARAREASGDTDGARAAYEEVFAKRVAALGEDHPQTAAARSALERLASEHDRVVSDRAAPVRHEGPRGGG